MQHLGHFLTPPNTISFFGPRDPYGRRGSHEIWHNPITQRNFAVPVGIPSRHTANAILRQAGLPKAF
jgi:hypothetical protein